MTENLNEQTQNENQTKTRIKKINKKLRHLDEEALLRIKLSRLSALEEDEDLVREEYNRFILL